ncbi:MAG: urea carboxylase-associated family protein [Chroococcidiopsidaceae cyanobacterium CP_BM_RX_35]|nr:urea carboxylase-associated family protein [Chroococcidiopsidaceae cyanobacterium CP_BM_RX_35]
MTATQLTQLDPKIAIYDEVLPAKYPWSRVLKQGQILRIEDLGGNQAVDFLVYNADNPSERYSAPDTLVGQSNIYLTTGSKLLSNEGRVLLTIINDTCGRHDTSGGACSRESNSVRFGLDKKYQHACVENFLMALAPYDLGKRDLVSNINFFMNVPVSDDGTLEIVDGISAPGSIVDLRAEMNALVAISNCPQINNPCNAYNPTPIRLLIWDAI